MLSVESPILVIYPCDFERFCRLGNWKRIRRLLSEAHASPEATGGEIFKSIGCRRLSPMLFIARVIAELIDLRFAEPRCNKCLSIDPARLVLLRRKRNSSSSSSFGFRGVAICMWTLDFLATSLR